MDVLNFISWLKSKKQVTTVDASQTLIPVGLKDARRKDGYLPGAISVEDLLAGSTPTFINDNVAYGPNTLINNEGYTNTAIGAESLSTNVIGGGNTTTGAYSLLLNSTGANNVAVGFLSLRNNTTGSYNTAVGSESLLNNTIGEFNTIVGINGGNKITTGTGNIGIGWNTLSGGSNITGQNNIGIGQGAGENTNGANYSIAIGSGTQINGYSCSIVLGQNAKATASNQLVIGSQFAGENIGTIATEALTLTKSWTVRINGVNYKIPLQVA